MNDLIINGTFYMPRSQRELADWLSWYYNAPKSKYLRMKKSKLQAIYVNLRTNGNRKK